MLTLYLLFGILYVIVLVGLYSKWFENTISDSQNTTLPKVSLLIPVRNESQNLNVIFKSISLLDPAPYEIIWIDDHSEDNTISLLKEKIAEYVGPSKMKLIINKGIGKKDAISTAIAKSTAQWVITTDADCRVPQNWLSISLPIFNSPKAQFFSGPIFNDSSKGFFNAFQQLDWASIALLSNAGVVLGRPLMASAANMGYKKLAFESIRGYETNEKLLSGDDEFLLKGISKRYGAESIVYNKKSVVTTKAHRSWKVLFEQRARWISKWKSHGSLSHALTSISSLLLQVFFLSTIVLLFFGKLGFGVFVSIWALKIIGEYVILKRVLKYFALHVRLLFYPLASIVYPFYVVGCIVKMLNGDVLWKGRRIKKKYL